VRVLLERLVEVAHPKEQQRARVAVLDLPVLPHERRLPLPALLLLGQEEVVLVGHLLKKEGRLR